MRRPYIEGTGLESFEAFNGRWLREWEPIKRRPPRRFALLTICSHAKPYSKSHIHSEIRKALYEARLLDEIEYVHLSSAGVVPAEADIEYPFCAYDWDASKASPEDIELHVARTELRLRIWYNYIGWQYEAIFVYLRPEGHTKRAVNNALSYVVPIDVKEAPPLPYALWPDVDDRLIDPGNLSRLISKIQEQE